jgi:hypothetical protein
MAKLTESGLILRPLHKVVSEQDPGMTDKLHSLMESYLPKDVPFIQKA